KRLVVFDFRPEVDDQRDALAAARERLTGTDVAVATIADEIARGADGSAVPAGDAGEDPLALLIYTSGSTGAPKGAMYPASKVADMWLAAAAHWDDKQGAYPSIVLSFMPMSHVMGRGALYGALSTGGTVYFAARPDLSTFLDDLALTRPTQLNLVPRVWDMIHQEDDLALTRPTGEATEAEVLADNRASLLGDRFVSALTGSAPIAPELKESSLLGDRFVSALTGSAPIAPELKE
ncbi:AMP-binding protein, partial [Mycolicibacterium gadium]|uniref:AMP-binding protein n=1 Tax=Mycolicibacterium gadium TaxID=1794 RepID=UPI0021F32F3B